MVSVRRIEGTDAPARALLAAMEEDVGRVHGPVTAERTSLVRPEEMASPRGVYVVLDAGGESVAGGGVRALADGLGEVKRMFVVPDWRRRGLGSRLLGEIEAAARELGFSRLRLDTAGGLRAFYERAGYRPIADYNGNTYATFWGEKVLR